MAFSASSLHRLRLWYIREPENQPPPILPRQEGSSLPWPGLSCPCLGCPRVKCTLGKAVLLTVSILLWWKLRRAAISANINGLIGSSHNMEKGSGLLPLGSEGERRKAHSSHILPQRECFHQGRNKLGSAPV